MVRFEIESGRRGEFLPLMEANARASMAVEPGCRQFDVVLPDDRPDLVLLYEVYEDVEAFEHHQTMPHFHRFEAEAAPLVKGKDVTLGRLSAHSPTAASEVSS